ncbi:hypothetical protein HELRODRAFT_183179 [Helobdella robusta]|uniref:Peptidase M12B domain-containing protein n=1 Tax=Helobdella robusta TaxID=6412 RepID=T1FJ95_HELRO|nr:hypothetical protein HELRODRAFT_183179 [Helobdella robusta]ESO11396.1 hypothetical protein HELRODRAFT_183179 [Helobdella robusta]
MGKNKQGLAGLKSACSEHGALISRCQGLLATTNTMAHELGHVLGAEHDGDGNRCNAEDGFIMAAVSENSPKNENKFSRCSKNYFEELFDSLDRSRKGNCLLRKHNPRSRNPFSEYLKMSPGRIIDPHLQCKLQYGPSSYYCHIGSDDCTKMHCKNPDSVNCLESLIVKAYPNTTCGAGRSCQKRQCLPDPMTETDKDSCFFGDEPGPFILNGEHYECLKDNVRFCYYKDFEKKCCKTCAEAKDHSKPEKCKFGDRPNLVNFEGTPVTCSKDSISMCYYDWYEQKCCKTCAEAKDTSKSASCPYGDQPFKTNFDGEIISCSKNRTNMCYYDWYEKQCCLTCTEARTNSKSATCPYGDKPFKTNFDGEIVECSKDRTDYCYYEWYEKQCCQSCAEAKKDPTCPYGDKPGYMRFNDERVDCSAKNSNFCYYDSFAKRCCKMCAETKDVTKPGCEYGNKDRMCKSYLSRGPLARLCSGAGNFKDLCCLECLNYE